MGNSIPPMFLAILAAACLLALVVLLFVLSKFLQKRGILPKRGLSRAEAAGIIDQFMNEKLIDGWAWDDFLGGGACKDPLVQKVVEECASIPDKYPPGESKSYCSEEGWKRMRELRDQLITEGTTAPGWKPPKPL